MAQKPSVFPAKERARLRMEPYTARRRVVPRMHRITCGGVALHVTHQYQHCLPCAHCEIATIHLCMALRKRHSPRLIRNSQITAADVL